MELIYRGIKYTSNNSALLNSTDKKRIIYCKQPIETKSNFEFPVLKYCKQLLGSDKLAAYHPIKFWYRHKSQHIENCWKINIVERLDYCWKTTLYIDQQKSLSDNTPVKLKYRGVTYYR